MSTHTLAYILVVFLVGLYHFTEQTEDIQLTNKDYLDVVNTLYQRRIIDIIISSARKQPSSSRLPVCPKIPPSLVGRISVGNLSLSLDIDDIIRNNSDVIHGGEWKPADCLPRRKMAIVVPYRDRWHHLKTLLHYLLPTLKRQQIHFRIFVVEQYGNDTFNKGIIMNAGFKEAVKLFDSPCVTFHDVDMVPEDDRNMYTCCPHPIHMSVAVDKFAYRLPYTTLVGGVLTFSTHTFQVVNGYSNEFWGWGGEDDDIAKRVLDRGFVIYRPPVHIARYRMIKHHQRNRSAAGLELQKKAIYPSQIKGLNDVMYKVVFTHKERLFTHFMVDIGEP